MIEHRASCASACFGVCILFATCCGLVIEDASFQFNAVFRVNASLDSVFEIGRSSFERDVFVYVDASAGVASQLRLSFVNCTVEGSVVVDGPGLSVALPHVTYSTGVPSHAAEIAFDGTVANSITIQGFNVSGSSSEVAAGMVVNISSCNIGNRSSSWQRRSTGRVYLRSIVADGHSRITIRNNTLADGFSRIERDSRCKQSAHVHHCIEVKSVELRSYAVLDVGSNIIVPSLPDGRGTRCGTYEPYAMSYGLFIAQSVQTFEQSSITISPNVIEQGPTGRHAYHLDLSSNVNVTIQPGTFSTGFDTGVFLSAPRRSIVTWDHRIVGAGRGAHLVLSPSSVLVPFDQSVAGVIVIDRCGRAPSFPSATNPFAAAIAVSGRHPNEDHGDAPSVVRELVLSDIAVIDISLAHLANMQAIDVNRINARRVHLDNITFDAEKPSQLAVVDADLTMDTSWTSFRLHLTRLTAFGAADMRVERIVMSPPATIRTYHKNCNVKSAPEVTALLFYKVSVTTPGSVLGIRNISFSALDPATLPFGVGCRASRPHQGVTGIHIDDSCRFDHTAVSVELHSGFLGWVAKNAIIFEPLVLDTHVTVAIRGNYGNASAQIVPRAAAAQSMSCALSYLSIDVEAAVFGALAIDLRLVTVGDFARMSLAAIDVAPGNTGHVAIWGQLTSPSQLPLRTPRLIRFDGIKNALGGVAIADFTVTEAQTLLIRQIHASWMDVLHVQAIGPNARVAIVECNISIDSQLKRHRTRLLNVSAAHSAGVIFRSNHALTPFSHWDSSFRCNPPIHYPYVTVLIASFLIDSGSTLCIANNTVTPYYGDNFTVREHSQCHVPLDTLGSGIVVGGTCVNSSAMYVSRNFVHMGLNRALEAIRIVTRFADSDLTFGVERGAYGAVKVASNSIRQLTLLPIVDVHAELSSAYSATGIGVELLFTGVREIVGELKLSQCSGSILVDCENCSAFERILVEGSSRNRSSLLSNPRPLTQVTLRNAIVLESVLVEGISAMSLYLRSLSLQLHGFISVSNSTFVTGGTEVHTHRVRFNDVVFEGASPHTTEPTAHMQIVDTEVLQPRSYATIGSKHNCWPRTDFAYHALWFHNVGTRQRQDHLVLSFRNATILPLAFDPPSRCSSASSLVGAALLIDSGSRFIGAVLIQDTFIDPGPFVGRHGLHVLGNGPVRVLALENTVFNGTQAQVMAASQRSLIVSRCSFNSSSGILRIGGAVESNASGVRRIMCSRIRDASGSSWTNAVVNPIVEANSEGLERSSECSSCTEIVSNCDSSPILAYRFNSSPAFNDAACQLPSLQHGEAEPSWTHTWSQARSSSWSSSISGTKSLRRLEKRSVSHTFVTSVPTSAASRTVPTADPPPSGVPERSEARRSVTHSNPLSPPMQQQSHTVSPTHGAASAVFPTDREAESETVRLGDVKSAAAVAAAISAVAVGLGPMNAGSVARAVRLANTAALATCTDPDEPADVDWLQFPLQVKLRGDYGPEGFAQLTGSLLLCACLVSVPVTTVGVVYSKHTPEERRRSGIIRIVAVANAVFVAFFAPSFTWGGVTLVAYGESPLAAAIAVLAIGVCAGAVVHGLWALRHALDRERHANVASFELCYSLLYDGVRTNWNARDQPEGSLLLASIRGSSLWWLLAYHFEVMTSVVIAMLDAWRSSPCVTPAAVGFCVSLAFTVYSIGVRPYTNRIEAIGMILTAVVQTAIAASSLAIATNRASVSADTIILLGVVGASCMVLQAVLVVFDDFLLRGKLGGVPDRAKTTHDEGPLLRIPSGETPADTSREPALDSDPSDDPQRAPKSDVNAQSKRVNPLAATLL